MDSLQELDDLIQGSTPSEKLENAKEIIQSLEKEVFKLRAELKRSENSLKKLQETSSSTQQSTNNTSSAFLLPSEFKKLWEILILENTLDLFQPFLSSQLDFVLLTQLLSKTVQKRVNLELLEKLTQIDSLLGISGDLEKVKKYMTRLFQDFCLSAFPCNLSLITSEYLEAVPKPLQSRVKALIETEEFASFVKTMHKLSIHMQLTDPPLELKFSMKPEYVTIVKPDDFYYIDGFPVGHPQAIIVLPAVLRNSQVFAGTKPGVLVLPENYSEPAEHEDRAKSEQPVCKSSLGISRFNDESEPYPPLQKKEGSRRECLLCKIKSPCAYCSKMTLLALAKRVPSSSNPRFISRVQSNSFIETPSKGNRNMTSCLSRRLSEAAKKIDKKTFIKNKHIDKEACKVM
jgi:hypothetical protein